MDAPGALLLDLDRTLIDLQSFTDYQAALGDVQELVDSWTDAAVPATDWDRATVACMSVLHSLLGDPRWNEVSDAIAEYERAAIPQSHLMPTVADCRTTLAAVPTAVVTLLPADVAIAVLDFHDLEIGREIDVVVGRDPLVRPKPEPDGVLEACRLLGVAPEAAVMIGDSTWDAQAAVAAGVCFIGVPPNGFDVEIRSRVEVADSMATALALANLQG